MERTNIGTEAAFFTGKEIVGQPTLWVETLNSLIKNDQIKEFWKPLLDKQHLNIILTGAGSSAYIGQAVEHHFKFQPGLKARAISTTTLVTHFKNYIDLNEPVLLISFARSGNSPESIAAIDIAESNSNEIYHIALTCNANGHLAKKVSSLPNGLAIVLPQKTEDQGLAMTGSFTSMMLSAIYLAKFTRKTNLMSEIKDVGESAEVMIKQTAPLLEKMASTSFDRIIFLGSGPLKAIARESHLKVQELSDGAVVGKFDSFLGFRHGPKAVVKENTLLVFLFSPEKDVFQYEKDLVLELIQENVAMDFIGVYCDKSQADEMQINNSIIFDCPGPSKDLNFNILPYVIPAQILGFYKSLSLGLNPDSPSENNTISRVVQGVKIYS